MSSVQIEQKSYEMPPREGISIAHFLTVTDIERSARYYEKVFGARILSLGDGNAPGYLQLANIWMILNVGGGPTPDKPTVTLSVPDPNHINSFLNFRVADIQACYQLWKSRGAEFITEPIPKYGETRCYIRDPDELCYFGVPRSVRPMGSSSASSILPCTVTRADIERSTRWAAQMD